jgi:hypothetical protein
MMQVMTSKASKSVNYMPKAIYRQIKREAAFGFRYVKPSDIVLFMGVKKNILE